MNRREYLQGSFFTLFTALIAACRKDTGKYPVIKKLVILNIDPQKAVSGDEIKVRWKTENIKMVSVYIKFGIGEWQLKGEDIDSGLNEFIVQLPSLFLNNDKLSIKVVGDGIEAVRPNITTVNGFIVDTLIHNELITIGAMKNFLISGNDVFVKRESLSTIKCFSSACTHAGCIISFLQTSNKFNCSCHGSQFDANGGVLQGPASLPLNTFVCETLGAEKFRVLY